MIIPHALLLALPPYADEAVRRLSAAWNSPGFNHSGLRATFRRWRPAMPPEPTFEMRDAIWGPLGPGSPERFKREDGSPLVRSEQEVLLSVDSAAILVAMRAVSGEHLASPSPFGTALSQAGIRDIRFQRFVTAPSSLRVDALHRMLAHCNTAGIAIDWKSEIRNMLQYLFGTDELSRRAVLSWSSYFFQSRYRANNSAGEAR